MKQIIFYIGIGAGFILPFFNIPLMTTIRRNRSSGDISQVWAWGVFVCVALMLPQTLMSPDWSFKIFGVVNFVLFSAAFGHILYYRR